MRTKGLLLGIVLVTCVGCKSYRDEFEQATAQNSELAAEMAKTKAAFEKKLSERDEMIEALEGRVEGMGGDLERVGEELAATEAEVEQLRALRARAEAERAQFQALTERFREMIDAGQLQVVRRAGRMMLELPDDILFPSGSKRLKQDGREALREVAQVLKEVGGDREYLVAGHTDDVPVKKGGRFANNWELSTARATTVVELMVREGVPPDQLAAAGYGEYDPIASNETREGRQQNRRLEIILMPKITPVDVE